MSNGKAADRTNQVSSDQGSPQGSSEQRPSGLLGSGLLTRGSVTWDSVTWDSCRQNSYGVGAAAAAGGAVGVALFDRVILVGAVAGLAALAHFLSGRIMPEQ